MGVLLSTNSSGASWQWRRVLPGMSLSHLYSCGCVLSNSRSAVSGGIDSSDSDTSSCKALTLDEDSTCWSPLPPMHEPRWGFACPAIGGCIILAGGKGSTTAEVYEEELGRWRQLPCSLPHDSQLYWMDSALM